MLTGLGPSQLAVFGVRNRHATARFCRGTTAGLTLSGDGDSEIYISGEDLDSHDVSLPLQETIFALIPIRLIANYTY